MVRSRHQLVERLALVFHDWFATSNDAVGSSRLMLDQTNLFRANGLGNFKTMVRKITQDPAMILFLDLAANRKGEINENYARELMELFTLGADRGAYTEDDVRELARSLSGWRYDWSQELGVHNFRWDEQDRWDPGYKTVFGKRDRWTWEDAARMVVEHDKHPSFFVAKLWSYFIPSPPDAATAAALEALYKGSGYQIRPVLEAILCAPAAPRGPAHGQAADRPDRRDAARPQARHHGQQLELGELGRRAARLLPAGRRGLGRQALARHQHHARALGGGLPRARRRHRESQLGHDLPAPRPPRPRWPRPARSGATPT